MDKNLITVNLTEEQWQKVLFWYDVANNNYSTNDDDYEVHFDIQRQISMQEEREGYESQVFVLCTECLHFETSNTDRICDACKENKE